MIYLPIFKLTNRGMECSRFRAGARDNVVDIAELFNPCATLDPLRIVPTFNRAKPSLVEYLLTHTSYRQRTTKEEIDGVYEITESYIAVWVGELYTFYICDYETKFMQHFINFETAKRLETADMWGMPTCAQDAKRGFYMTLNENVPHGKNIYNLRYPEPGKKEYYYLLQAKELTRGYTYAAPGEYSNIYAYDIKQSYPARLWGQWTPFGEAYYFTRESQIRARWWYVKKIRITSLQVKTTDYLKIRHLTASLPSTIHITTELEQILKQNYFVEYRLIDGFMWKMRRKAFDLFLSERINNPANATDKPCRTYRKGQCNLLVGTYAAKPRPTVKHIVAGDTLLSEDIELTQQRRPFLPIYLYVVGSALRAFISFLVKYPDDILYANTDGFMSRRQLHFLQTMPPGSVGYLEERKKYTRFAVKALGNYAGEYIDIDGVVQCDIKLIGKLHKSLTYNEFINGFNAATLHMSSYGFVVPYISPEPPLSEYLEGYRQGQGVPEKPPTAAADALLTEPLRGEV